MLSYTLEYGLIPFANMILKNGGEKCIDMQDSNGNNALHYLSMIEVSYNQEFEEMCKYMIKEACKRGRGLNKKNSLQLTPFHLSIVNNRH